MRPAGGGGTRGGGLLHAVEPQPAAGAGTGARGAGARRHRRPARDPRRLLLRQGRRAAQGQPPARLSADQLAGAATGGARRRLRRRRRQSADGRAADRGHLSARLHPSAHRQPGAARVRAHRRPLPPSQRGQRRGRPGHGDPGDGERHGRFAVHRPHRRRQPSRDRRDQAAPGGQQRRSGDHRGTSRGGDPLPRPARRRVSPTCASPTATTSC